MNKMPRSVFIGAALALLLAGCQKNDTPPVTSSAEPSQSGTSATPIPPASTRDPFVPDAATVFAAQDAVEKAQTTRDTTTLQQQAAPQEKMTKEEEVKAMPLPGQANDHSTTALDKSKGS